MALGFAVAGELQWAHFFALAGSQVLGGIVGACCAWAAFAAHFRVREQVGDSELVESKFTNCCMHTTCMECVAWLQGKVWWLFAMRLSDKASVSGKLIGQGTASRAGCQSAALCQE